MKMNESLYVTNRDDWRAWLSQNHDKKKEIWLIYFKKHTRRPRIPYDDAVEEAICFGWIDTTVKRLDDERFAQKFTPRGKKSEWSEHNRRRALKMIKEGKMTEAGRAKIGSIDLKKKIVSPAIKKVPMPADLSRALKARKNAFENFSKFAPSYRQLYMRWIMDAKKPETRMKRIQKTVQFAAKNRKPGMM